MFIDEKGKLFSKVSIVDILILLFFICIVAFVGMKYVVPNEKFSASNFVDCEYTITIENVRDASVNAMKKSIGKSAFDSKGVNIGRVKEVVSVENYKKGVAQTVGSMELAEMPDKYVVKAVIETSGTKTYDSIMIANKSEITVGNNLLISTPEIMVEAIVSDIVIK